MNRGNCRGFERRSFFEKGVVLRSQPIEGGESLPLRTPSIRSLLLLLLLFLLRRRSSTRSRGGDNFKTILISHLPELPPPPPFLPTSPRSPSIPPEIPPSDSRPFPRGARRKLFNFRGKNRITDRPFRRMTTTRQRFEGTFVMGREGRGERFIKRLIPRNRNNNSR